MYLKLIILAIIIIGFAFAGFAIKMFFQKNGEFKKQCSSMDANGNRVGCGCGGGAGSCERETE
ncbi:MAG: membrane or secreted protein [Bacteroidetes bacterium]|jgi:hypothetical protein|nr:membrane or secreted protein [Bacteroidota bacterium]MBU1580948.1 membrane or secreted protein [Bacteroidota bacterium]MBU2464841.1 membrane or secreted protein [Bacteroidota bacterium]MBU2557738.1 membrane or secreted protein [Bacteroidota bacterium]MDA3943754.1 membrane or secreted protein [Bacteroidota bacterium]